MMSGKPVTSISKGIKCFSREECDQFTKRVFALEKTGRLEPCENTWKTKGWHYQGTAPENTMIVPIGLVPEAHDMGMKVLPLMEREVFKKLYPTYVYARLYRPGYELCRHTDRPSCEYSVSVTMGMGGRKKPWMLYYEDGQFDTHGFDLDVGYGMVYDGCIVPHWRQEMTHGWQLQVFFHYIEYRGQYYNDAMHIHNQMSPEEQKLFPIDFSKPWCDPNRLRFKNRPGFDFPIGITKVDFND